jgi:uncharacterized protein YdhG (YjbR/CyaY superfamily)
MNYKKSNLVDEYISETPAQRHEMLQTIRNLILETATDADEMISQRMPSYKLYGKQLAYFSNGKNHIGFFVGSSVVDVNQAKLKEYVTCNSGFQLKLDVPLPLELMRELLISKIEMIKKSIKK